MPGYAVWPSALPICTYLCRGCPPGISPGRRGRAFAGKNGCRKEWRDRRNRAGGAFPRTCSYRWAPGNRTTIRTEPAPSDLLKATGMGPVTGRAEPAGSLCGRGGGGCQPRVVLPAGRRSGAVAGAGPSARGAAESAWASSAARAFSAVMQPLAVPFIPPSRIWRGCVADPRRCPWPPPCDRPASVPAPRKGSVR